MTASTPTTRRDAVTRVIEDGVTVAGTAITAWQTSHSIQAVAVAAASAPVARSALALLLSQGRVSGIVLAIKLVWQALAAKDTAPAVVLEPVHTAFLDSPVFAPEAEPNDAPAAAQPAA